MEDIRTGFSGKYLQPRETARVPSEDAAVIAPQEREPRGYCNGNEGGDASLGASVRASGLQYCNCEIALPAEHREDSIQECELAAITNW